MGSPESDVCVSFPPTHWSWVGRAGHASEASRRLALGALLERYLPALRAFLIVEKRIPPDRAADLLQGFVSDKIVEHGLIGAADPRKGKFRTFLLTALRHYVADQARLGATRKRAPGDGPVMSLEHADRLGMPGPAAPSEAFDVAWAREVLAEAVRRMREQCQGSDRPDLWGVFQSRVLAPAVDGTGAAPYEQLVERFGFKNPAQACNALITAKRMFVRVLRSVVGEYAEDEATVDEEIDELKSILSRSGAAPGTLPRM